MAQKNEVPDQFWVTPDGDPAMSGGMWWHEECSGVEAYRADHALALVAAERCEIAKEIKDGMSPNVNNYDAAANLRSELTASYVLARTDAAAQAALEARDKRVREEALREALQRIADLPTGDSEEVTEGQYQSYRAIEALFEVKPWIEKDQVDDQD